MHKTGAELQAERERAGLTQKQVAEALALHPVTIANWEARAMVPAPKAERYLRVVRDLASVA